LVGARSSQGFGYGIPLKLKEQGWADRTYLVNPRGGQMHGMPVYRSVDLVPDPVDLAVVIVPAPAVPEVLVQIGRRGIGHVIVQSAGFAETGPEGKALQAEVNKAAKQWGLRVIGPNCVGVVNTGNRLATAEVMPEAMTPGRVAVIAQSGVFGHNLIDRFNMQHVFVSKVVTLGNRMDVSESEMLEYFRGDPTTGLIVMYLEGAADGRLLVDTLKRVTREKPVLVLKSGRTSVGRAATASHTGSMSGHDALYESLFAQTGTIRAASLQELVDLAQVFATQPLPRGNRVGILTGSGSMGALAADAAVDAGLRVPPLSAMTEAKVRNGAPVWMNAKNPLDVGPSGMFPTAFKALMEDPGIDMVLAIVSTPYAVLRTVDPRQLMAQWYFGDLEAIRKLAGHKPLLLSVVSHQRLAEIIEGQVQDRIPVFTCPEVPAQALAALWRYGRYKEGRDSGRRICV